MRGWGQEEARSHAAAPASSRCCRRSRARGSPWGRAALGPDGEPWTGSRHARNTRSPLITARSCHVHAAPALGPALMRGHGDPTAADRQTEATPCPSRCSENTANRKLTISSPSTQGRPWFRDRYGDLARGSRRHPLLAPLNPKAGKTHVTSLQKPVADGASYPITHELPATDPQPRATDTQRFPKTSGPDPWAPGISSYSRASAGMLKCRVARRGRCPGWSGRAEVPS